jgi:coenzyme PQQ precursor peptide PqqA
LRKAPPLPQTSADNSPEGAPMKKAWRKPKVREISAAMEINCYCSAE